MAIIRQRMPVRDAMIEAGTGLITRPWRTFLRDRDTVVADTPVRVGAVELEKQVADITPPRAFPVDFPSGLYRVMVYARRTVLATTSSKLGVTIHWSESGVALELTTGLNVDNKLDAVANAVWMIRIDPYSQILYEVEYDSVGATAMQYRLDITVEQVKV